jgi:hypothetical protein
VPLILRDLGQLRDHPGHVIEGRHLRTVLRSGLGRPLRVTFLAGPSSTSAKAFTPQDRLATLPFIEHDLVTFDYIELDGNSSA